MGGGMRSNRMVLEQRFMRDAIAEAKAAAAEDEAPIGAVIVRDGIIIASAHNLVERLSDASAHAEILAIRRASQRLGGWRLRDCILYVTLEPCAMCMGACINSQIGAVAFGAYDRVYGCCSSVLELGNGILNSRIPSVGGMLEAECAGLLSAYFSAKRAKCRGDKAIFVE